jgi:hypothetical protein
MRLAVGSALNVVLLLMLPRLAMSGGDARDFRMALACAVVGAVAMVCVVPVIRRGTDLQRVAAIVVLILSALAFWPAADFYLRMRT